VTYCSTDGDGFAVREDFVVDAFFERPLMQSIEEVLPEHLHLPLQEGTVCCYEGHKNASFSSEIVKAMFDMQWMDKRSI